MVAHDLRPCVSADHEHLCALHDASADEDDLTRGSLTKAESLVDKPLVDGQLHDFGVVFLEAGFVLLVLLLRTLSFQPLQTDQLASRALRVSVVFLTPAFSPLDETSGHRMFLFRIFSLFVT